MAAGPVLLQGPVHGGASHRDVCRETVQRWRWCWGGHEVARSYVDVCGTASSAAGAVEEGGDSRGGVRGVEDEALGALSPGGAAILEGRLSIAGRPPIVEDRGGGNCRGRRGVDCLRTER